MAAPDVQTPSPGLLVLVRHGESEGNQRNIFTGWRDLPLTEHGQAEALEVAERLAASGFGFDVSFNSALGRAQESANIILKRLGVATESPVSPMLNERNYGELTGLNKTDAAARWGVSRSDCGGDRSMHGPPAEKVCGTQQGELHPSMKVRSCLISLEANAFSS